MRKILLFFLGLILLSVSFIACGDNRKPIAVTNAFAFMQEVPNQNAIFTPMLGQYAASGGRITFQTAAASDITTGAIVQEDFGSMYLSKAGDQLAFDMWGGTGSVLIDQWDIYVANADGSVTQITDDSYEDAFPQLSPDGSKVVFTSYRPTETGTTDVVVIRNVNNPLAGEVVIPMPLGATDLWAPTFSPDGTKIAVEALGSNEVDGEFDGILIMNADGSNPQLLTNPWATCDCWDMYPSFTPDGSGIVYNGYTWDGSADILDIYIMNTDGSGNAVLTDSVGYNLDPLVIHVSGMADQIVFHSDRDNIGTSMSTGFELYSMNLDGSNLTRLTHNSLFDGLSAEGYSSGTAKARIAGLRNRHEMHSAGQRSEQHPIRGMKW